MSAMQIRITGLPVETDTAVAALRTAVQLAVVQISGPYPNRGESRQVRVYVTALIRAEQPGSQR